MYTVVQRECKLSYTHMHSSSHIATVCCQIDVSVCPQATFMHAIIHYLHCTLGTNAEHMNIYNCAYTYVPVFAVYTY